MLATCDPCYCSASASQTSHLLKQLSLVGLNLDKVLLS